LWPGYRNRQPSLLRTHPNSEERIDRLRSLAPAGQAFASETPVQPFLPGHWPPLVARPRQRWHGLWY
ncbi:MAG TPA: Zn-dependent protease, partial [bacterium]